MPAKEFTLKSYLCRCKIRKDVTSGSLGRNSNDLKQSKMEKNGYLNLLI